MSKAEAHDHLIQAIRHSVIQLTGNVSNYQSALELVGDAHFMLIGEATHGTGEFYRFRTELAKLPNQFATVVHINTTHALQPLDKPLAPST